MAPLSPGVLLAVPPRPAFVGRFPEALFPGVVPEPENNVPDPAINPDPPIPLAPWKPVAPVDPKIQWHLMHQMLLSMNQKVVSLDLP